MSYLAADLVAQNIKNYEDNKPQNKLPKWKFTEHPVIVKEHWNGNWDTVSAYVLHFASGKYGAFAGWWGNKKDSIDLGVYDSSLTFEGRPVVSKRPSHVFQAVSYDSFEEAAEVVELYLAQGGFFGRQ